MSKLPDAWQPVELRNFLKLERRKINVVEDHLYRQIGIRSHGLGIFHKEPVSGAELGDKRVFWVEPGDFTLNIVFAWEDAVALVSESERGMCASHRFPTFRVNDQICDSGYLLKYFKSEVGIDQLKAVSPGGAGRNKTLSQSAFLRLKIPLPPLPEQRAIAAILSTWDEAIKLTERMIEAVRQRKQALMQMLLTGEVRFSGFEREWSAVQLKDSFDRITRPIVEELENVLSITATKGFVDQKSKFGRTIAGRNLEKYIHLKHGEFAYNKGNSNTYPQGCIYRLEEFQEGAVPNVYYCFSARSETTNGDYFKYYFESGALNEQLSRLINSGVRNDGLLNLSADNFFAVEILVPPLLEQEQIAAILSYADSALKDVTQMLDALRMQNRGLMQQLLTGAIRVQVEE